MISLDRIVDGALVQYGASVSFEPVFSAKGPLADRMQQSRSTR